MRESTVTAAAVAMAIVCPAHADTRISLGEPTPEDTAMRDRFVPDDELVLAPSLVVGAPDDPAGGAAKLDRVKLAVRDRDATLTLSLSTKALNRRELVTMLDVPTGAHVTGLAVTIGGQRFDGAALASSTASARYHDIVDRKSDPALLEHTESTRRHDRLTLRVFPVAKTTPATVEVRFSLPDGTTTLELDPGAQTIAKVDLDIGGRAQTIANLSAPRSLELPAFAPRDDEQAPYVTTFVSLFAGASTSPMPFAEGFRCACPLPQVSVDKQTVHDLVKLRVPRLRHCFMREAQRDPTLAGSADLHFTIGEDGRTSEITVDGTLPSSAVMDCIANEAATWTFHANTSPTRVNYPLSFAAN
jgi:hypothetical protein